jgi:phospholipid/cholesterol/gamma-HCH transport system permease protein
MVARVGRWFLGKARDTSYALGFFYQVLRESFFFVARFRRQTAGSVLLAQILFTGVNALSIIALVSVTLGAIIIIQGMSILPQFGQGGLIYTILVLVITREMGPLLTAFIIIARSATAIATELGNMVVSHEIEAYVSVGVDPVAYLVVPRFLGVTVSLVILTIYFNLSGLIASFLISQLIRPIQFAEYFRNLLGALQPVDVISSLTKSVVFGAIIASVATFQGFRVKTSATEIPVVVIRAVGQGFVLCFLANALITVISYL